MHVPACLIWGKQDHVTPPEVAEDFMSYYQTPIYLDYRCGHAAMMETPDEFNSILENWFKTRNI